MLSFFAHQEQISHTCRKSYRISCVPQSVSYYRMVAPHVMPPFEQTWRVFHQWRLPLLPPFPLRVLQPWTPVSKCLTPLWHTPSCECRPHSSKHNDFSDDGAPFKQAWWLHISATLTPAQCHKSHVESHTCLTLSRVTAGNIISCTLFWIPLSPLGLLLYLHSSVMLLWSLTVLRNNKIFARILNCQPFEDRLKLVIWWLIHLIWDWKTTTNEFQKIWQPQPTVRSFYDLVWSGPRSFSGFMDQTLKHYL